MMKYQKFTLIMIDALLSCGKFLSITLNHLSWVLAYRIRLVMWNYYLKAFQS